VNASEQAIPPTTNSLDSSPTDRSEAWLARTANAAPVWQATMPSHATVVAGWCRWLSGLHGPVAARDCQPTYCRVR
jgi:hypothetical protein